MVFNPSWKQLTIASSIVFWLHGSMVAMAYKTRYFKEFTTFTFELIAFFLVAFVVVQKNKTMVRLLAAMAYIICSAFTMTIMSAACFYRNPSQLPILPDYGFDLIPVITHVKLPFGLYINGQTIPDILFPVLMLSTVTFVLIQSNRLIVLRRLALIWGTTMFVRTFTLLCTAMPDASPICQEITAGTVLLNQMSITNILNRAFYIMLGDGTFTCGDLIFSGHTTELMVCGMVWHTYYPIKKRGSNVIKALVWFVIIILLYVLIGCRSHYTIDCVLAVYINITIWNLYHRFARDVQMGIKSNLLWFLDDLIYSFINWFEQDENDLNESRMLNKNMFNNEFDGNNNNNSYELVIYLLCNNKIEEIKELISKMDVKNLNILKNGLKYMNESYLNEIYKLYRSEEELINVNEKIDEVSKVISIKENEIKVEEDKIKRTSELYESKIREDELLKNNLMQFLNDGNIEDCLKLL